MNKKEFEKKLFTLMIDYLEGKVELQIKFYKQYSCNALSKMIIKKYFEDGVR